MRSDTVSMLNDFTAEQLLWVAIRSNARMRALVMQVIESRAGACGVNREPACRKAVTSPVRRTLARN